jgi:hypothetical protein
MKTALVVGGAVLLALLACKSKPEGKIVKNFPASATVNTLVKHQLTAEPATPDSAFRSCGEPSVSRTGAVSWLPLSAGKRKACFELTRDGKALDRYELEVNVTYAKGGSPAEQKAALESFVRALKNARADFKKAGPDCSTMRGVYRDVYDDSYLAQLDGGAAKPGEKSYALVRSRFAEPLQTAAKTGVLPTNYADRKALLEHVTQPYVLLAVADKVDEPKTGARNPDGTISIEPRGSFSGHAVFVDVVKGQAACRMKLAFRSAAAVHVLNLGSGNVRNEVTDPNFDPAVDDFAAQLRKALHDALDVGAPQARLSLEAAPKKSN